MLLQYVVGVLRSSWLSWSTLDILWSVDVLRGSTSVSRLLRWNLSWRVVTGAPWNITLGQRSFMRDEKIKTRLWPTSANDCVRRQLVAKITFIIQQQPTRTSRRVASNLNVVYTATQDRTIVLLTVPWNAVQEKLCTELWCQYGDSTVRRRCR